MHNSSPLPRDYCLRAEPRSGPLRRQPDLVAPYDGLTNTRKGGELHLHDWMREALYSDKLSCGMLVLDLQERSEHELQVAHVVIQQLIRHETIGKGAVLRALLHDIKWWRNRISS